jgi:hypothetical protein
VHANSRGEGIPATCQTAMVMGHHLQIVATLETGEEVVARQRRAGDDALHGLTPGDKLWLGWSPTATLLLGPSAGVNGAASAEPVEVQA